MALGLLNLLLSLVTVCLADAFDGETLICLLFHLFDMLFHVEKLHDKLFLLLLTVLAQQCLEEALLHECTESALNTHDAPQSKLCILVVEVLELGEALELQTLRDLRILLSITLLFFEVVE